MPKSNYILAIDEGTTGSTALLIDKEGQVAARAYRELRQIYPQPGWVEHDPNEILHNCIAIMREVVQKAGVSFADVKGIGITNQRETTVVWERDTGKPVDNAIVWQCRRTAPLCEELKKKGFEKRCARKPACQSMLIFPPPKCWSWIISGRKAPGGTGRPHLRDNRHLDCLEPFRRKAHVTDYSNASRTMLFNINTLKWDKEFLKVLIFPNR